MAELRSSGPAAPAALSGEKPAAGNGGVFLFSLLLAIVLGGFFLFPAEVKETLADGTTKVSWDFKFLSLFGKDVFGVGAMIFLILCALSTLALLAFGLFIRNALRGIVYAILGLAGVGTMVYMVLIREPVWGTAGTKEEVARQVTGIENVKHAVLGGGMDPQIQLLFVMGVALLFSVMIGAARARVLFPDNASSKIWSVVTALGLLAIFAVPIAVFGSYNKWANPLEFAWIKGGTGKDVLDFGVEAVAGLLGLLLVLTCLFGVGGGRSSRGRGVFVMGVGTAIAVLLPLYFFVARPDLLREPVSDGPAALGWLLQHGQFFLAGASAWAFFAMVGLGVSDLICQGEAARAAGPVVAGGGTARAAGPRAAPLNPQQQQLDQITKLYQANLLTKEEFERRRAEILGR